MEKVDVAEMAEVLADPQKWLDSVAAEDWDIKGEDVQSLYRLACFLVKEIEEEKGRAYKAWCNEHNLNPQSNEVHYLHFTLLPLLEHQRELISDYGDQLAALEIELENVKRTLRAVEETQQFMNDRVNCLHAASVQS